MLYIAGIVAGLLIDATDGATMWIALGFYVVVALMWLIPDQRIKRVVREQERLASGR